MLSFGSRRSDKDDKDDAVARTASDHLDKDEDAATRDEGNETTTAAPAEADEPKVVRAGFPALTRLSGVGAVDVLTLCHCC